MKPLRLLGFRLFTVIVAAQATKIVPASDRAHVRFSNP